VSLGILQQREYFLLNCQFVRIRQLESIAGEDFDSVIGPGIVRSGKHDSGVEFPRARKVRDSGRGDNACAMYFHTERGQSGCNAIGDPAAGLARVLADHDPRTWIRA